MISGLPERIKELRISHGFSQKDVADKLKLSASIVSGYETGERTPSTEILLKLSNLYKCSTDYLLGKEKISPDFLISIEDLTKEQQKAVQSLIDSMRKK